MLLTILLLVWAKKVNIAVTWWKKHFNKKIVMTKEENEDFKNCAKCWICNNEYIDNDVKVRDHYHTRFQFLSSSLNSLIKNLNKDEFRNLDHKFDNNVLDLVKQKGFYP